MFRCSIYQSSKFVAECRELVAQIVLSVLWWINDEQLVTCSYNSIHAFVNRKAYSDYSPKNMIHICSGFECGWNGFNTDWHCTVAINEVIAIHWLELGWIKILCATFGWCAFCECIQTTYQSNVKVFMRQLFCASFQHRIIHFSSL